jgi:hypothetical protein
MRRRIKRRSQCQSAEHDKDYGGKNVDCLRRQAVSELVSQVDDGRKNVNTNRTIKIILLIMTV